jgi:probable O-glycosylation ligase (exosortase A-associated)
MALRDLVLFVVILGTIPFILWRAPYGVLVWSWLAYMSPHRLTWGAAADFRFSVIIGAVLLVATVIWREPKRMVWSPTTVVWGAFFAWTALTTQFAFDHESAMIEWSRWWKINLVSLLTLLLMQNRERLHQLVWVVALSLGFYGMKGGVFTILTGGGQRVWGPPGSFIEENNALGLALILIVPLMRYLQLEARDKWVRLALGGGMVLTAFAILGTQSRGAFLGLAAMGANLVWKSPGRWKLAIIGALLVPVLWAFMPSSWHSRMNTIETYDQDESALGRINAWWFAFNLAKDHPVLGGGFNAFTPELFQQYAPDPNNLHDAHSIYFEVLGEQGFVGLGLFALLGFLTMRNGAWVARHTRGRPDLAWARNLSAMLQVSIVGYAVSGAFLGLAYFDLVYHLVVMSVLSKLLVERALAEPVVAASSPAPPAVRAIPTRAGRAG